MAKRYNHLVKLFFSLKRYVISGFDIPSQEILCVHLLQKVPPRGKGFKVDPPRVSETIHLSSLNLDLAFVGSRNGSGETNFKIHLAQIPVFLVCFSVWTRGHFLKTAMLSGLVAAGTKFTTELESCELGGKMPTGVRCLHLQALQSVTQGKNAHTNSSKSREDYGPNSPRVRFCRRKCHQGPGHWGMEQHKAPGEQH